MTCCTLLYLIRVFSWDHLYHFDLIYWVIDTLNDEKEQEYIEYGLESNEDVIVSAIQTIANIDENELSVSGNTLISSLKICENHMDGM